MSFNFDRCRRCTSLRMYASADVFRLSVDPSSNGRGAGARASLPASRNLKWPCWIATCCRPPLRPSPPVTNVAARGKQTNFLSCDFNFFHYANFHKQINRIRRDLVASLRVDAEERMVDGSTLEARLSLTNVARPSASSNIEVPYMRTYSIQKNGFDVNEESHSVHLKNKLRI